MKHKLTVELKYFKKKSKLKHYAFSIQDLADLFNVHPKTIYIWTKQKKLDPTDLKSIISVYNAFMDK